MTSEPHKCEGAPWTVYLARSLPLHKIGITCSLPMRLRGLRNGSAAPVDLVASLETCCWKQARKAEVGLHNRFYYCRDHGEWFALDAGDVCRIMRFLKWPWLHRSLLKKARRRTRPGGAV